MSPTARTDTSSMAPASMSNGWQPWRTVRELLNWDPFRQLEPFAITQERAFTPDFEISENKDSYLFKADMPGIKESDIKISLTGNHLTVSGKRESSEEQKGETFYVCERSYGEFSRSFTLPDSADAEHVKAALSSGVLVLSIPKKPGAQTKQIAVQAEKTKP